MNEAVQRTALDGAKRAEVDAALDRLVENGDIDRLVWLARLIGSAQDSMTDDMVGRLASVATDSIDFLDMASRSGLARALPAVARLIDNGDLDRTVDLVRLVGAAQDSMTDDMMMRLAGVASHGLAIVETLTTSGLGQQLMALAQHLERSRLAPDLLDSIDYAARQVAADPPPKGGMAGLAGVFNLMKKAETQRAIHFAVTLLCSLCQARLAPHMNGNGNGHGHGDGRLL